MAKTPAAPRYGNSGNRWWVGQNVGETGGLGGTPTLTLVPSPSGYESLPSGDAADDAQFAAAAKKNKAGKPVTISVQHVNWYNINGPYPTQAEANAAIPVLQKKVPAEGEAAQVAKAVPGGAAISSVGDFISILGEASTWIRIAKVAMGGIILAVGLAKLTGADQAAGSAVKTAVKVAPFL